MSKLEKNELPENWRNLFDIKKQINIIGGQDTFNEMMAERVEENELQELYDNFKKEFALYPKNHPLYLEAQKIMLDMGFKFYEDEEEKQVELLPKEVFEKVYENIDPENPVKVMSKEEVQNTELTTKISNLELTDI